MLDNFPEEFRRDDEKVLNEFRQKQVNFSLEERKNEANSSRSLFIGALAGLIMAGVVGWFILAPRYQGNNPEDVPVITRPQEPVKIQPAEPGDVEFAAQERTVYDIIEKRQTEEENDKIVTSAEEPNAQGIEQLVEKAAAQAAEDNKAEQLAKTNAEIEKAKVEADKKVSEAENKIADAKEEVKLEVTEATEKVTEKVEKVKAEPVKEIAQAPVVEASSTSAQTIKAGSWQVQLMSSPNKSAVEKSWNSTQKKYAVLQGLPYEIEKADLGAKGIYYRLKVGSFANKSDADALCAQLKKSGGSCFVAKK